MKRMRNVFFKTGICLLALVVMVGIALPCRAADLSTVETVLAQTITSIFVTGLSKVTLLPTRTFRLLPISGRSQQKILP